MFCVNPSKVLYSGKKILFLFKKIKFLFVILLKLFVETVRKSNALFSKILVVLITLQFQNTRRHNEF